MSDKRISCACFVQDAFDWSLGNSANLHCTASWTYCCFFSVSCLLVCFDSIISPSIWPNENIGHTWGHWIYGPWPFDHFSQFQWPVLGPHQSKLGGGFNPIEKYLSKWPSSPNRGENKKTCETTSWKIYWPLNVPSVLSDLEGTAIWRRFKAHRQGELKVRNSPRKGANRPQIQTHFPKIIVWPWMNLQAVFHHW